MDDVGFGASSSYGCQTVINHVNLITEEIWDHLNRIVAAHGLEVLGVAPDAPMEARCDSYVVETHVEHPRDVRLLRDRVLNSFTLACKAWEAHDLGSYGVPGWRQKTHLIITVTNGYLTIQSAKKRAKHPELVLDFFSLCYTRIRKCVEILDALRVVDPTSVWISRLEKAIEQFHTQIKLVHRRVMEGEKIPNAEKLLSLHAEPTRWIRKGKSMPKEVELGVPVAVIENQHRLILGWEIMWTESDVDMTVPIVDKYTEWFPSLESISFDRGYGSVPNFETLSSRGVQVILPKKGYKNKEERARESTCDRNGVSMRRLNPALTGWDSMGGGPGFGPKGARQDLCAVWVQVWWPQTFVGLGGY
ncbi:MAG: hypothetical protein OXI05_06175 [Bacteroidota bacterium]|nr:hypothetical protein [Bacteroidota bacterium]